MTFIRKHLSIVAIGLVVLIVLPAGALAQVVDEADTVESFDPAPAPAPPETGESRIGAMAAMACGFFARLSTAPGGPYTGAIVGAVASCLFMVLDAFVFDPPSS